MVSQKIASPQKVSLRKRRKLIIPMILVLILALGAAGFTYWQSRQAAPATATDTGIQTARVRQGTLTLSATGSGTLAAGETAVLSFPIDGKVASVDVKVGDVVKSGQALAELYDITEVETAAKSAELDLKTAQEALDDLRENAGAALAEAQLAVVEAKKALVDAQSGLIQPGMARCDQETIDAYYSAYMRADQDLAKLGDGGGNQQYYLNTIVPAKNRVAQAYATYEACAGFTEYEIDSSQANLSLAEITLQQAQADLDDLLANSGIDSDALAEAENNLANAQIANTKAQKNLARANLTAPFDGTIMSVAGEAGDEVEANATFITMVDLSHPIVNFAVDETDFDKVSVGNRAVVVFDALPDDSFTGEVTQVNPSLTSSNGYSVVEGIITLQLDENQPANFLTGMNATVEIIAGEAQNALLVPIEALRDLGDGQYGVFVVDASGQPRLTMVEVGLMDATYAEIKSGLEPNATVSTGNLETE